MPNLPPQSSPGRSGHRWLAALVGLQALTLAVVLADQPFVPAADAQTYGLQSRSDGNRPQNSTLPNAAEQRAEQVRALNQIVKQLEGTNARLDRIEKLLDSGNLKVQTGN